jgi:hypothetical protein
MVDACLTARMEVSMVRWKHAWRWCGIVVLLWAALCLNARPAAAQDAGQVGLTVGSDGSVGVIWHATTGIAVQPAIQFRSTSIDIDAGGVLPDGDDSAHALLLEVTAPLYVARWDSLRGFVAPRIAHTFESGDESGRDRSNMQVAGLFGLQYALSDRFHIVGTTGVSWARTSTEQSVINTLGPIRLFETTTTTVGSTSRLGLIVYF